MTAPDESSDSEAARRYHRGILICVLLVCALSALLQVVEGERVALLGFPDYPLPHSCWSRSLFGLSCPGCGLTRSFIHLAHGDWQAAWAVHRLGWLLATWCVAQIPYRLWVLHQPAHAISYRPASPLWWSLVGGLLLANWLYQLRFPT